MHDHYEEVPAGESMELGTISVTKEEIKEFAEKFDPQSFHLSDESDGPFGGIIASGWHTASMTMRLLVDDYLGTAGAIGSPGLAGLEWSHPVRPGDTLGARLTFGKKEPWDKRRGVVHLEVETENQNGERVLWMDSKVLYPRGETGQ